MTKSTKSPIDMTMPIYVTICVRACVRARIWETRFSYNHRRNAFYSRQLTCINLQPHHTDPAEKVNVEEDNEWKNKEACAPMRNQNQTHTRDCKYANDGSLDEFNHTHAVELPNVVAFAVKVQSIYLALTWEVFTRDDSVKLFTYRQNT